MQDDNRRLLLVGWEVGDWEILHPLVDSGMLPTLQRLVEEGAIGSLHHAPPPVAASRWTSLATGKRAWQHRVCLPVQENGRQMLPVGADARHARTLWEILADTGRRSLAVGWPATHGGLPSCISVSDRFPLPTAGPGRPWPGAVDGTYQPSELAARLDALRVSPENISPETIAQFVPEWRKVDQNLDPGLSLLRILLATDFSYQAAITELMAAEPWEFAAVRFPAAGEICRLFARHYLSRNDPTAKAQTVYQQVVPNYYQLLDSMLKRLIDLAGPETAVVLASAGGIPLLPHGAVEAGGDPADFPVGMLLATGAGFTGDVLLHGARALDVVPTILNWFGLSCGDDMEGRSIEACLSAPRKLPTCATWEKADAMPVPPVVWQAALLLAGSTPEYQRAFQWNLTRSLLDAGRPAEALPLLETLFQGFPENPDFSETLFRAQLAMGRPEDAQMTMVVLEESLPALAATLSRAELAWACGESELTRQHVLSLLKWPPRSSPGWHRIGMLLLALREWEHLESCARAILAQNEGDDIAWLGLAESLLRRRDFDGAAKAAQRSIALRYSLPEAHLALARALAGSGLIHLAIQSVERLLLIQPDHESARYYLRRLRRPGHAGEPLAEG